MIKQLRKWLNLSSTECDLSGFIEKESRDRGAFLNMECGDYETDISARIKAQEAMQRQMRERKEQNKRLETVRQITIELVTQRVANGRVGTEPWALRAAIEQARPEAERIYDVCTELVK